MPQRKTWREKLADTKDFPRVQPISEGMSKTWGTGTIVIPAPREVDEIMKRVPKGKLTTINHIREVVANRHGASIGCPICVGIFARTAAGAAEEDGTEGKKRITPYWRTLRSGGEINPKYPGGVKGQRKLLEAEGHKVVARGTKYFVQDFDRKLARIV